MVQNTIKQKEKINKTEKSKHSILPLLVLLILFVFTSISFSLISLPVHSADTDIVDCIFEGSRECFVSTELECNTEGGLIITDSSLCELDCYNVFDDSGEAQFDVVSKYYADRYFVDHEYDKNAGSGSEEQAILLCREENLRLAESPEEIDCSDGVDNDGDGLIDLRDPGCGNNPYRDNENNLPFCSNNIEINAACSCGGRNTDHGYCCNNNWQINSCDEVCEPGTTLPTGEENEEGCAFVQTCQADGTYGDPELSSTCGEGVCSLEELNCGLSICSDVQCGTSQEECQDLGYERDPLDRPGVLSCCALGLVDCNGDGMNESCGVCDCTATKSRPTLYAIGILNGQAKFNITYSLSCAGIRLSLERSESGGPFVPINSFLSSDGSFIDTVKPETNYTYRVVAHYGNERVESDIKQAYSGDKACLLTEERNLCTNVAKDQFGRDTVVICGENNKIISFNQCTINPNKFCGEQNNEVKCLDKPVCLSCSSPLGLYYDENMCNLEQNEIDLCYLDTQETNVDAFESCEGISYCGDYHSEAACGENKCIPDRDCDWNEIRNRDDILSNKFDKGVCVEQDTSIMQCNIGEELGTYLFGEVNDLTCDLLSNDNTCVLFDDRNECLPLSYVTCASFDTETECTGGTETEFDIEYNEDGIRVSGTNEILTSNDNVFISQSDGRLAVCSWTGSKCIKDADDDGNQDLKDGQKLWGDMTPPQTALISNSVNKDFSFTFSSYDYLETELNSGQNDRTGVKAIYYCIDDEEGCYPDKKVFIQEVSDDSSTGEVIFNGDGTYTIKTGHGHGKYYMNIYAEDGIQNLEKVQQFELNVDRKPPEITLSSVVKDSPTNYARVEVTIQVSEDVTCDETFDGEPGRRGVQLRSYTPTSPVKQTFFAPRDGYYQYTITCEDGVGNIVQETIFTHVDIDKTITNPRPSGVIDDRYNKEMSVNTQTSNICTFRQKLGTRFSGDFQVSGSSPIYKQSVQGFTPQQQGLHIYEVRCGDSYDEISFVYDTTSPQTTLVDGQGNQFNQTLIYDQGVNNNFYLNCIDNPPYGFDCDETLYCFDEERCEPDNIVEVGVPLETESDSDKLWLCYKSKENEITGYDGNLYGGKESNVVCREIKKDTQRPIIVETETNLIPLSRGVTVVPFENYVVRGQINDPDAAPGEARNKLICWIKTTESDTYERCDPSGTFGANFDFNVIFKEPVEGDEARQYNFINLTAIDRSGMESEVYKSKVLVGDPPEEDELIRLVRPVNGITEVEQTHLAVATFEQALWCRIGVPLSGTSELSPSELFLQLGNEGRLQELVRDSFYDISDDESGETLYGYRTESQILFDTPGKKITRAVQCQLRNGIIPYKEFTLKYDNTPPVIRSLKIQPSVDTGSGLLVIERGPINLIVETDDETICKYSDQPMDSFGMTEFDNTDNFTQINSQRIPQSTLTEGVQNTLYVICENGAYKKSARRQITFDVDYNAPVQIILAQPKLITGQDTTEIKINTTKIVSECTMTFDDATSTLFRDGDDNRHWKSNPITLTEGSNQFSFTCVDAANGDEVTNTYNIILDKSAPIITNLVVPSITKENKEASVKVEAEDNQSNIINYSYMLGYSANSDGIMNLTYSTSDEFTIEDLNLTNNQRYYWTVAVQNEVGLWSQNTTSNGTLVDVNYFPSNVETNTCNNGVWDEGESDVDCGGVCNELCAEGLECTENDDCRSNNCVNGFCRQATCTDGIQNNLESDVDCGGPNCASCSNGLRCNLAGDCTSFYCDSTRTCTQPSCSDGIRNGDEEGVDCGGSCQSACVSTQVDTPFDPGDRQVQTPQTEEKTGIFGTIILLLLLIIILGILGVYVYYVKVKHESLDELLIKFGLKKKPKTQNSNYPMQSMQGMQNSPFRQQLSRRMPPKQSNKPIQKIDKELIERRRMARQKQRESLLSSFDSNKNKDDEGLKKLDKKEVLDKKSSSSNSSSSESTTKTVSKIKTPKLDEKLKSDSKQSSDKPTLSKIKQNKTNNKLNDKSNSKLENKIDDKFNSKSSSKSDSKLSSNKDNKPIKDKISNNTKTDNSKLSKDDPFKSLENIGKGNSKNNSKSNKRNLDDLKSIANKKKK